MWVLIITIALESYYIDDLHSLKDCKDRAFVEARKLRQPGKKIEVIFQCVSKRNRA